MRYADIKPNDSVNGEGVCVSLFVQGCNNFCEGCFNKETWDFNGGKPFGGRELQYIKRLLTANNINSIDINITIIFFLFKKIPHIPSRNNIMETVRYLDKSIVLIYILLFFNFK